MKLFYRDFGGEGKEPLVILHGLFGSSRNWQTVGKKLARYFHIFALDLPDHGESPSKKDLSYPSIVEDVLETLDELGLNKIHLLGHSWGGQAAMHLACHHSQRIVRLIIVDVAPKNYPSYQKEIEAMIALDLARLTSREEMLQQLNKKIPDKKTCQFLLTNLARTKEGPFRWIMDLPKLKRESEIIRKSSLTAKDHFDGPALFIVSRDAGYVTVEDCPKIRAHFPRAEITALPDTGHNIHLDALEKLIELINH